MVLITQEISLAHNPQPKANAQCAHRKTQNKYLHKSKNKKRRTNRAHHDDLTMDNDTTYEETKKRGVKKTRNNSQEKRWRAFNETEQDKMHNFF